MPTRFVKEYLSELRTLPVPWVATVAERAAWIIGEPSIEPSSDHPENEIDLAVAEYEAILEAFEQEVGTLKALKPAIASALSRIVSESPDAPGPVFRFSWPLNQSALPLANARNRPTRLRSASGSTCPKAVLQKRTICWIRCSAGSAKISKLVCGGCRMAIPRRNAA